MMLGDIFTDSKIDNERCGNCIADGKVFDKPLGLVSPWKMTAISKNDGRDIANK